MRAFCRERLHVSFRACAHFLGDGRAFFLPGHVRIVKGVRGCSRERKKRDVCPRKRSESGRRQRQKDRIFLLYRNGLNNNLEAGNLFRQTNAIIALFLISAEVQFVHGVVFCKPAGGRFFIAVQKVAPRIVHCFYDKVKAYLARICKEVCKA